MNYTTPLILDYQANGQTDLKRQRSDYAAPHGIYPCKGEDRWVAISVSNGNEWEAFKKVLGCLSWAGLTPNASLELRLKNNDRLDEMVAAWTAGLTPEQVMAVLQGAGVAAGVVSNAADLDNDIQLNYYNFYRELDHPYMGKLRYYHPASLKLSRAEAEVKRPVLLGEHTDYICKEILGMSQAEIDDFKARDVFK